MPISWPDEEPIERSRVVSSTAAGRGASPLRSALLQRHPSVACDVEQLRQQKDYVPGTGEYSIHGVEDPAGSLSGSSEEEEESEREKPDTAEAACQTARRGPYELDEKELKGIRKGDGDKVESLYHEGILIDFDAAVSESDSDDELDGGYNMPPLEAVLQERAMFDPRRRIRQLLASAVDEHGVSVDSQGRRARHYGAVTLLERAKLMLYQQEGKIAELMRKLHEVSQEKSALQSKVAAQGQQQDESPEGPRPMQRTTSKVPALVRSGSRGSGSPAGSPSGSRAGSPRMMVKRDLASAAREIMERQKVEQQAKFHQLKHSADGLRTRALQLVTQFSSMVATYMSAATPAKEPPRASFIDLAAAARNLLRKNGVVAKLLEDAGQAADWSQPEKQVQVSHDALVAIETLVAAGMPLRAEKAADSSPQSRLSPDLARMRNQSGGRRNLPSEDVVPANRSPSPAPAPEREKLEKDPDPTRDQREKRLSNSLQQILDLLDYQTTPDAERLHDEEEREGMRRDAAKTGVPYRGAGETRVTSQRLQRMISRALAAVRTRAGDFQEVVNAVEELARRMGPPPDDGRPRRAVSKQLTRAGTRRGTMQPKPEVDMWKNASRDLGEVVAHLDSIIKDHCTEAVIRAEHRWREETLKINQDRAQKELRVLERVGEIDEELERRLRPLRRHCFRCLVEGVLVRIRLKHLERTKSAKFPDWIMFGIRRAYFNRLVFLSLERQRAVAEMVRLCSHDWERQKYVVVAHFTPWKKSPNPRTVVDGRRSRRKVPSPRAEPQSNLEPLWAALCHGLLRRHQLLLRAGNCISSCRLGVLRGSREVKEQMHHVRSADMERQSKLRAVREKEESLSAYATRVARGMFCRDIMKSNFSAKNKGTKSTPWESASKPMSADQGPHVSGSLGQVMQRLREHFQEHLRQQRAGPEPVIEGSQFESHLPQIAAQTSTVRPTGVPLRPQAPARPLPTPDYVVTAAAAAAAASDRSARQGPPEVVGAAPPVEVTLGGVRAPLSSVAPRSSQPPTRELLREGTPDMWLSASAMVPISPAPSSQAQRLFPQKPRSPRRSPRRPPGTAQSTAATHESPWRL